MGKTYEALMEAERLRATQDPAALARQLTRAAEERETIASDLRACQEQIAEQGRVLSSLSAEAMRIVRDSVDESQAAQRAFVERLAVVEEAQRESDRRLQRMLGELQSSLSGRTPSEDEISSLRAQVALLVEAHGQQRELAEGIERAKASADEAARRVLAIDDAQTSSVRALRQQMETLQAESARLLETVGSVQTSLTGPLRSVGEIETLRAQVASLVEGQAQHQQLADGIGRAQSNADEMARRVTAIDKEHASSLALLRQQVVELQLDRGTLQDALGALRSSLAQQRESAAETEAETEALRVQMAPLVEAQLRQQELIDNVARAQATADEAVRQVAVIDEAQAAALTTVLQQVAALEADGESMRDALCGLRTQVAPLVKAQLRQRELINDVARAQAAADEAVRQVAMIDKGQSADLTALQQQLDGLLADKAKLNQVIETRFELLCGILDETIQCQKDEVDRVIASFDQRAAQPNAELQAKVAQLEAYVDELRTGARAQPEPERTLRKTLTNGLIRRTSSRKLQ